MLKRICAVLAVAAMTAVMLFSGCSYVRETGSQDGFQYALLGYEMSDERTMVITGYTGSNSTLKVPSEINGYPVQAVMKGAFAGNTGIVEVEFNSPITVGTDTWIRTGDTSMLADSTYGVFEGCTALKKVTLRGGVTALGTAAFKGCTALCEIEIPSSMTSIGREAFANCTALEKITLNEGVRDLGYEAFLGCDALRDITLPASITTVSHRAFAGCDALETITVPDNACNMDASSFDDTAYYQNEDNWTDGVLYVGNHLIVANKDITSHSIKPNTVTIAANAFDCEKLTEIVIPSSVKRVGNDTFERCKALKNVRLCEGVQELGYSVFYGTAIEEIVIPSSMKTIGEYAFAECPALKKVMLSEGVQIIESGAFKNCTSLCEIAIPASVKQLGDDVEYSPAGVFEGCESLASITIPDDVRGIQEGLLADTAYYRNESNWTDGVLYVGNHLIVANHTVTSHVIKPGTVTIAANSFDACDSLENVTLPDSIKEIGKDAFDDSLTKVTYEGSRSEWKAVVVRDNNSVLEKAVKKQFRLRTILMVAVVAVSVLLVLPTIVLTVIFFIVRKRKKKALQQNIE